MKSLSKQEKFCILIANAKKLKQKQFSFSYFISNLFWTTRCIAGWIPVWFPKDWKIQVEWKRFWKFGNHYPVLKKYSKNFPHLNTTHHLAEYFEIPIDHVVALFYGMRGVQGELGLPIVYYASALNGSSSLKEVIHLFEVYYDKYVKP